MKKKYYEDLGKITSEQLVEEIVKIIKRPMLECIEFVIEERMKICLLEVFKNLEKKI
jgi:hypothetical protein